MKKINSLIFALYLFVSAFTSAKSISKEPIALPPTDTTCMFKFSLSKYKCKNEKKSSYTVANVGVSGNCVSTNWVASTNVSWITTSSSGVGSGNVEINVLENTGDCSRFGSVKIGSDSIQIEQPGKNNNLGCAYKHSTWFQFNANLINHNNNKILSIKPTSELNVWTLLSASNI